MGSNDADSREKKPAVLNDTSLHQSHFSSQSLGLLSFSQKKENMQNVPAVHFSNFQHGRGRTHNYFNCSCFHSRVEGKLNSKGWVHFTAIVSGGELLKHSFLDLSYQLTVSCFPGCLSFTLVASSL